MRFLITCLATQGKVYVAEISTGTYNVVLAELSTG